MKTQILTKLVATQAILLAAAIAVHAQDHTRGGGIFADRPETALPDTTLCADTTNSAIGADYVERGILESLPSREKGDSATVVIDQSEAVEKALLEHVRDESNTAFNGYRVRIFFPNAQNARGESAAAADLFSEKFPGYPVYRTYTSPNFKVTVGDFRRKSDAMRLLDKAKAYFPYAFVIEENISIF